MTNTNTIIDTSSPRGGREWRVLREMVDDVSGEAG